MLTDLPDMLEHILQLTLLSKASMVSSKLFCQLLGNLCKSN